MAAVQQYEACMGIMIKLCVDDLNSLKEGFEKNDDGLSLEEFVVVMLEKLTWTPENVVLLVRDLIELFAQVDVNGDKSMEWEEFTSFIIEAGGSNADTQTNWRDLTYVEKTEFIDSTSRQPKDIYYIPELRKVFVTESNRPVIQVYDPSPLYASCYPQLALVNQFHPLCYLDNYRKDQDEIRSERSPVQVIKYLTKVEFLAISPGDLTLSFWSSTSIYSENPSPLYVLKTPNPQRILEWSSKQNLLFGASTEPIINVWTVFRGVKNFEVNLIKKITQHDDLINCMLVINDKCMATCSRDTTIKLWDINDLIVQGTRSGHKQAIRLLERCSDTLFLSAGYDFEILAWDISGINNGIMFSLSGHTSPVCALQVIEGSDQAISVDDDGFFRWWNLEPNSSSSFSTGEDSDYCLQTFRMGNNKYPVKTSSFTILNNGNHVVATSYKLKCLQRIRSKPRTIASSTVLYNAVSFTVLSTTDKEIQIWDAATGNLLSTFRNISSTEITAIQLDGRKRKFILANQAGEVMVFNYLNGAMIKDFPSHNSQVSSLIYCDEDSCVISGSWDRTIRVYDDDSTSPLLRCVTDAHDSDITCLAFSFSLGLIASGSRNGSLKVWDYIYLLLDGECLSSPGEVTALAFVEPYPLLISGHANGKICFWPVRPYDISSSNKAHMYCLAGSFSIDDQREISISNIQILYDESEGEEIVSGIQRGRHILYIADEVGNISSWDITKTIDILGMKTLDENKLPCNTRGYNPRRRLIREGKNAKRSRKPISLEEQKKFQPIKLEDVKLIVKWKAHYLGIRHLQIVDEPSCLLSCSHDKTIRSWSLKGDCLGLLNGEVQNEEEKVEWNINVCTAPSNEAKLLEAEKLWEHINESFHLLTDGNETARSSLNSSRLKKSGTEPYLRTKTQEMKKKTIFRQLNGEKVWKKSHIEIAKEAAWEKEKKKFIMRTDQLSKKQTKKKAKEIQENRIIPMESLQDGVSNQEEEYSVLSLPKIEANHFSQIQFDDLDNWNVDSLNRQKLMYGNLSQELFRWNNKGKPSSRMKKQIEVDLTPSQFLLDKHGPDILNGNSWRSKKKGKKKKRNVLRSNENQCHADEYSTIIEANTFPMKKSKSLQNLKSISKPPRFIQPLKDINKIDCIIDMAENGEDSSKASEGNSVFKKALLERSKHQANIAQMKLNDASLDKSTSSSKKRGIKKLNLVDKSSLKEKKAVKCLSKQKRSGINYEMDLLQQSHFGVYKRQEVQEVIKVFSRLDSDRNGSIQLRELKDIPTSGSIKQFISSNFASIDGDQDGSIELNELLKGIFPKASSSIIHDMRVLADIQMKSEAHVPQLNEMITNKAEINIQNLEDITALFKLYDVDKSGGIDPDELFANLCLNENLYKKKNTIEEDEYEKVTVDDIKRIFAQFDSNDNTTLELPEFIELFKDVF